MLAIGEIVDTRRCPNAGQRDCAAKAWRKGSAKLISWKIVYGLTRKRYLCASNIFGHHHITYCKMLIKASALTNLTDARYFAAKDVAYMGFNLEEGTTGYLDPIHMRAIREWVEGPQIVGEFSRSSLEVVREAAVFYGLEAVQVPLPADIAQLALLEPLEVLLVLDLEVSMDLLSVMEQTSGQVAHFLLCWLGDLPISVELLAACCTRYSVLLQNDWSVEHTRALVAQLPSVGLSLMGGEEERTGVKSFEDVEAVFDWLED